MQRRYKLSRSRDFDLVYRRGSSVSSRYLVLHVFPRSEDPDAPPRLGLAVPRNVGPAVVRNRVKRGLREVWRALLAEVPPGRDYVLTAKPGLAEVLATRGQDWLRGEVRAILDRAQS
ncbi:MAG: ribonuclease P protein component [Thermoleophilia bacterium]|nr:ribonuclease P protein component [Thermoleophilia bacterium]